MRELIVEEKSTLFDKAISIGGIIIGASIITAIAMQHGFFILGPIVLGVIFLCIIMGYFFAKR